MGDFNRGGGNRFGGGNRGGGSRFGGDRRDSRGGDRGGDREVTMHQATCAECHKTCEVPFRPTNDRPVYCKDCFASRGAGSDRPARGDFENRSFSKPRFDGNRSSDRGNDRGGDDTKRQLEMINTKLDKLISIMGGGVSKKPATDSNPKKEGLTEALKEAITPAKAEKSPSKKKATKKKSTT